MKERPILFPSPMVRDILDGRKTQTRRVMNPQPTESMWAGIPHLTWKRLFRPAEDIAVFSPYGKSGDHLWVRETFRLDHGIPVFRASCLNSYQKYHLWKPSIFMPRWVSRITLEIVKVRIERLKDISTDDCIAEGVNGKMMNDLCVPLTEGESPAYSTYRALWDSINGKKYPWSSNPWVWVIEFKRIGT